MVGSPPVVHHHDRRKAPGFSQEHRGLYEFLTAEVGWTRKFNFLLPDSGVVNLDPI